MKNILKLAWFLIFAIAFSCEEQVIFVKCPDCLEEEPLRVDIQVKLDINDYAGASISVYEGNLEDNILIGTYTTHSELFTYDVPLNKKYTFTASYYVDRIYYITVDSATPRVKYEKEQCDDPCYYVYNDVVDLRLKYTK